MIGHSSGTGGKALLRCQVVFQQSSQNKSGSTQDAGLHGAAILKTLLSIMDWRLRWSLRLQPVSWSSNMVTSFPLHWSCPALRSPSCASGLIYFLKIVGKQTSNPPLETWDYQAETAFDYGSTGCLPVWRGQTRSFWDALMNSPIATSKLFL